MERIPLQKRLSLLGAPAAPPTEGNGRRPAEPIPLARRLSALDSARFRRSKGLFIGYTAYFRGISVLCRSPEPERRAEELAKRFEIPPNMRLSALVRYAFQLGADFPDWEADGDGLLHALLIEPFGLMGCLPPGGRLNPPPEDELPF